jgi:hypothetical protein
MPPKKLTPRGQAAEPAGAKASSARKTATKAKPAPKKRGSTTKYIRNIRGVEVRVTFDTGRRVNLMPRGQRNDMVAVSKEELEDPIFLDNLAVLYEVISAADAESIREKQFTNASSLSQPRPENTLMSPLGKPINFTGLEPSNIEQSITIGQLREVDGRTNEQKATEITRSVQPSRANVPGSSTNEYGKPISIAPQPPVSEQE